MPERYILARCPYTKGQNLYLIKLEQHKGDWLRTSATKMDEKNTNLKAFEKTEVVGSLNITSSYPGCPYCGEKLEIVFCSCGRICCYREGTKELKCPWCEQIMSGFEDVETLTVNAGNG
jgi:uncharacterized protein YbaR (Trm112 family)